MGESAIAHAMNAWADDFPSRPRLGWLSQCSDRRQRPTYCVGLCTVSRRFCRVRFSTITRWLKTPAEKTQRDFSLRSI